MARKRIRISEKSLRSFYGEQKLSIRRLSKVYGCGATTIQRRLHEYKFKVRPSMSIKINIPKDRVKLFYEKQKRPSAEIARIFSCNYATILNRLKEYNIKTRDICESHIKYPKKDFSGNLIEKAYLIGFRLGDLHVRRYEKRGKVISIECASTHLEQISLIRNLFKNYGYVRISSPDKKGISRVQCSLNPSFNFLLNKQDKIDSWILSNKALFFSFLAGYTDAEGDIGVYFKNKATLRIGTCDKNILSQIQKELFKAGISSTLVLEKHKGSRVNLPKIDMHKKKQYKTSKDFWRLGVYRKKALLKLLNLLGPRLRHQRFKQRLLEVRDNIVSRNQEFGNLRMN